MHRFFNWNILILFKCLRNFKMISLALEDKKILGFCLDILLVRLCVRNRTMWHGIACSKKTVKRLCHP